MEAMTDEVTFYRDMWLAQRAENEIYRARLGEMPVSDEASEEIVALRADNERLKACLHDYENTYPEAKDTLRAEVEHWKAIAQAHNDSLVARIEENKKLTERLNNRPDWKHSLDLQAENERLREALQQYADMEGPPFFGTPYLARAALQSKGE
jgi:hypothetical protein